MIRYKFIKERQWKDVHQRVQKLNADIASATEFVREIERGNLNVSIGTEISDSELKTSLVSMRDQMKKYSLTEQQRNWVNEGLAKFVHILRSGNNDGRRHLADNIIRNLVSYLKANQGALFALNDDDPKDIFLEIEACYAYDRKKFLEKRIALGEGLAGQVVLEKSILYMTDVPKDFIKITSGLGEALPRNILLVPLKLDEKIFGVVELASFLTFEPYEIEFVEKLGESIASTIAAVKSSERTEALLKETQLQTEQLKAQEEEVRQNLEELSATQEAMQRATTEVELKEAYVSQILNTSQDIIYTVDREFRMVTWNSRFAHEAERIKIRLEKGMNAFEWSPDDRKKLIGLYKRVFNGETFELQYESDLNGKKYNFLSVYAPIKSAEGEIVEAAIYARNVTPMVEAQQKAERLLNEAQQQAEELKAQEEELRQNMEELTTTQEEMERLNNINVQTFEQATDAVITIDSNKSILVFNKAAEEMFGYKREEVIGENVKIVVPVEHRQSHDSYVHNNIKTGDNRLIGKARDLEMTRKDGTRFWGQLTLSKIQVRDHLQYTAFVKDITDNKLLEKEKQEQETALRAQEEELRQNMEELSATQEVMEQKTRDVEIREEYLTRVLNTSHDVIFTVDQDFKLVTWNESFARSVNGLGVHLEKGIIAFGWRSDEERQHFAELFKRVFNGESFETNVVSKFDGTTHHFLSTFSPLRNKANEIIEAVVFARDITRILNEHGALIGSEESNGKSAANKGERRKNSSKFESSLSQSAERDAKDSSNGKSHS